MFGATDSGLLGSPMKEAIPVELFGFSKNGLALGGASLSASRFFKMSKQHRIQKVKDLTNTPCIKEFISK